MDSASCKSVLTVKTRKLEEPSDEFAPDSGRNLLWRFVVSAQSAGVEVDLSEFDELCLVPKLPADPGDEEDRDAEIARQEPAGAEVPGQKNAPAREKNHYCAHDNAKPTRVRLQARAVREL